MSSQPTPSVVERYAKMITAALFVAASIIMATLPPDNFWTKAAAAFLAACAVIGVGVVRNARAVPEARQDLVEALQRRAPAGYPDLIERLAALDRPPLGQGAQATGNVKRLDDPSAQG